MEKPKEDLHDPWTYASRCTRSYITPEDIGEAIKAGASAEKLHPIVLEALSKKVCEDWSLCAFVAFRMDRS